MTDGELRDLARRLQAAGTPCVALDPDGLAVEGLPSGPPRTGDALASFAPGWRFGGPPVRAMDGRWVEVERLAVGATLALAVLRDRTSAHVLEEARELAARRRALAELAGATAREMNDPMTIVQGRLELIRALGGAADGADRHCAIALEHAQRVSGTLHSLRLVGAAGLVAVGTVDLGSAIDEALDQAGLERDRLRVDVHPPDLRAVGQCAAIARVFAGVLRALASGGRDPIALTARRRAGRVSLEFAAHGRRRADLDALPLGLVTALLDALGGSIRFGATGVAVDLPDAAADPGPAPAPGEVLVVGEPVLADRIARLLAGDGLTVVSESTAEAAHGRLRSDALRGVVAELLVPEQGGLELAWEVQRRRPDVPMVLVTLDRVTRLPPDVRTLRAPIDRERLVNALAPPR